MSFVIKALGISSICIGGTSALGYGYKNSEESFYKYLDNVCLPEEVEAKANEDWKKAQDKLNTSPILTQEFKDLKTKIDSLGSDSKKESGELLKDLCTKIYGWVYKSWFLQKSSLFQDLEKFCSLSIEDKLEKNKLFIETGNENQQEIKKKVEELQKHTDGDSHGTLIEPLITLKTSKNETEDWQKLKKWCQDTYKEAYLGTRTSNKFKLTQKYCQKN